MWEMLCLCSKAGSGVSQNMGDYEAIWAEVSSNARRYHVCRHMCLDERCGFRRQGAQGGLSMFRRWWCLLGCSRFGAGERAWERVALSGHVGTQELLHLLNTRATTLMEAGSGALVKRQ